MLLLRTFFSLHDVFGEVIVAKNLVLIQRGRNKKPNISVTLNRILRRFVIILFTRRNVGRTDPALLSSKAANYQWKPCIMVPICQPRASQEVIWRREEDDRKAGLRFLSRYSTTSTFFNHLPAFLFPGNKQPPLP